MRKNFDDLDFDRTVRLIRCFSLPANIEIIKLLDEKKVFTKNDIFELLKPMHNNIGNRLKRLTDYYIIMKNWENGSYYYKLNEELVNKILAVVRH